MFKYSKNRNQLIAQNKFLQAAKPLYIPETKVPKSHVGSELVTLEDYLSLRRPAWSWGDDTVIEMGIAPLKKYADEYWMDEFGNVFIRIGTSSVGWSCHTDTAGSGGAGWRRPLKKDGKFHSPDDGVLGADDGTGMWMMASMIRAQKPGFYIFHRAEEIGGQGSSYIASTTPEVIAHLTAIIAIDRRGTGDVITHQAGGRCCSNDFALSLAEQLGGDYKPSSFGVFTDTANYTEIIPECTNLSTGYRSEHSRNETQDIAHAEFLLDKVMNLDYDKLEIVRDPLVIDYNDWGRGYYGSFNDWSWDDYGQTDIVWPPKAKKTTKIKTKVKTSPQPLGNHNFDEHTDMLIAIEDCMDEVADFLFEMGFTPAAVYNLSDEH